jgi:hypothetical protein
MKWIVSCLLIFGLSSCYISYKVTRNGIKSNDFISRVTVVAIAPKNYDQWGVPDTYNVTKAYSLNYKSGSEAKKKKVFFFKPNYEYNWVCKGDSFVAIDEEFKRAGWYLITELKSFDRSAKNIIYFLDEKGKVKSYYRSPQFK